MLILPNQTNNHHSTATTSLGLFSSEVYDRAWQLPLAVCSPLSRSSGCCHDVTNSDTAPLSEPHRLKKTDIYLPLWAAVWAPQHWLPIVRSSPSYASLLSASSPLSDVEKPDSPCLSAQSPSETTLCFVMIGLQPWQLSIGHIWISRLQSFRQIKYQDISLFDLQICVKA